MKIAIITYDAPHRKTQDLLSKLLLYGYSEVHLVVTPWAERKNFLPIFRHRPTFKVKIGIETMCERLNIDYSRVKTEDLNIFFNENLFDHIIIGGAGILPEELAMNHKIINSHPGYLPNMKGLDALKWAIYDGEPLGVTTHYISEKADEGELIDRTIIPIYFEDTFHSVAYRVYEYEIDMLVGSIEKIEGKTATLESLSDESFAANRRMPHHLEMIMMTRFEDLRKKSPSFKSVFES